MAATMQFILGVDEPTIPEVKLTRSRDGSSGTATFVFDSPAIFEASSELGDITGLYLVDDEGVLQTVEVQAQVWGGGAGGGRGGGDGGGAGTGGVGVGGRGAGGMSAHLGVAAASRPGARQHAWARRQQGCWRAWGPHKAVCPGQAAELAWPCAH